MCECVLSRFSRVPLCATLWTVAHQAPLSMGFFRQEYWSGLPFLPPGDLPDPAIEPCPLPLAPPGKPFKQLSFETVTYCCRQINIPSIIIFYFYHFLSQSTYSPISWSLPIMSYLYTSPFLCIHNFFLFPPRFFPYLVNYKHKLRHSHQLSPLRLILWLCRQILWLPSYIRFHSAFLIDYQSFLLAKTVSLAPSRVTSTL